MPASKLESLKLLLKVDPGDQEDEWKHVYEAIQQTPSEANAIWKWVFQSHKGYVSTRVRAGQEFYRINPKETWIILDHLIHSTDPDDRDTALSVASTINDPHGKERIRSLITDSQPYIQLEAAKLLAGTFPHEVKASLASLSSHRELWIQEEALRLQKQLFENPE